MKRSDWTFFGAKTVLCTNDVVRKLGPVRLHVQWTNQLCVLTEEIYSDLWIQCWPRAFLHSDWLMTREWKYDVNASRPMVSSQCHNGSSVSQTFTNQHVKQAVTSVLSPEACDHLHKIHLICSLVCVYVSPRELWRHVNWIWLVELSEEQSSVVVSPHLLIT